MSSLERLNRHLAEFRGEVPATMTDMQLKMELGYQLMQVMTPSSLNGVSHLPLSSVELAEVFEGVTWHYNEGWSQYPKTMITTSDGLVGVVQFGDQITYEIVDEPLSSVDWSYECKSESS